MGWKRALGISALVGARRDLDELLATKREYEQEIKQKTSDSKECEKCLPDINRKIAKLRAKVEAED